MNNIELVKEIDAYITANRDNIIEDLRALIAVPSVEGAAQPGAPFGEQPQKALEIALQMAQRMGFETYNSEGYIGWAEIPGQSGKDKYLASITHLDVVPEGNGWTQSPYELRIRDGYLIGRGVADDKGPSVIMLYAANFVKNYLPNPKYTFRVLLGCNEETGMEDVEYYQEKYPEPLFLFSPDASFPVCNGEKGGYRGNFISPKLNGNIVDFKGGVAGNVVPDRAHALVKAHIDELPDAEGINLTADGELVRIGAMGKGGHAASPEGTKNAIGMVVNYLLDNRLVSGEEKAFLEVLRSLFCATDGSGLGIASTDPEERFTPLTCIGGLISMKDGVITQDIDIRYPTTINGETITEALQKKAAEGGAAFVCNSCSEPFYISADNDAIRALIDTYNKVNGCDEKPFTMGGGTYARHFKNAVSFGVEDEKAQIPDFVGPMHGADEGISEAQLLMALKVYILAVLKLMELEF
ncbi:MAG: Sapep family Mn(2+)-dependent dipeptidase [Oscillospiraceae bacterium]|nr:Sapep family Mn(2+)-dependent dipeptidase [Oscillospiraceae bacterium]